MLRALRVVSLDGTSMTQSSTSTSASRPNCDRDRIAPRTPRHRRAGVTNANWRIQRPSGRRLDWIDRRAIQAAARVRVLDSSRSLVTAVGAASPSDDGGSQQPDSTAVFSRKATDGGCRGARRRGHPARQRADCPPGHGLSGATGLLLGASTALDRRPSRRPQRGGRLARSPTTTSHHVRDGPEGQRVAPVPVSGRPQRAP